MPQEGKAVAFSIDASDPLVVFGALAALIFLGFAGNLIFSRLRFNDTLILILVGVLIGPVFQLVDAEPMLALSGIIGPLALILILFDGGLALKFRDLAAGLGPGALLGLIGYVATVALVGGLTALLLDTSILRGMILGSILGGTSSVVVLSSLANMRVEKRTGTILGLESALTDILVVVVTFTLISIAAAGVEAHEVLSPLDADQDALSDDWETRHFGAPQNATAEADPDEDGRTNVDEMRQGTDPNYPDEARIVSGGFDAQGIASKLLITFAMSVFMGLAAGLAWLLLYPRLREKPFGYMLTLGFMFAMYVFVEWILRDVSSGGGPLAVLAFGIILGNNRSLGTLGRRVGSEFGETMKRFQGEISFLVRTFFFVFLGIIVDLDLIADVRILAISIILLAGMIVARYLAVVVVTRRLVLRGDDMIMLIMMPRGLAAAVLAGAPAAVMISHLDHVGIPGTENFVALAFLLLVWTNLLATIGALVIEKKGGGGEPGEAARAALEAAGKDASLVAPARRKGKGDARGASGATSKGKAGSARAAATGRTGSKGAGKAGGNAAKKPGRTPAGKVSGNAGKPLGKSSSRLAGARVGRPRSTTQAALEDMGR